MDTYIKYKRITETVIANDEEIQKFFDKLISGGWEIIYYNETPRSELTQNYYVSYLDITTIVGKKQNNKL